MLFEDINECERRNNCSQICINESPGYSCSCQSGYRLGKDKRTCEGFFLNYFDWKYNFIIFFHCFDIILDKDECSINKAGCVHFCINLKGWLILNECLFSNLLFKKKGTFKCACTKGFYLGSDRRHCFGL